MKFDTAVFEVGDLCLSLHGQHILDHISFQLLKGDYAALIGPNGGGKTTLIRILMGLQKPSSGQIKLFGIEQNRFKQWDKIGYVPQRVAQVDRGFPATVEEIVMMGRTAKRGYFKRTTQLDHDLVEDAMKKMDVLDLKERLVGELSGGQRQRVMIARALASEPEVLILDEPNTGVDVVSQQRFYSLLRDLNQKEHMTILFVTHDVGVIADDIGRLFTVNQTLLTCNDPKEALSCSQMSKLYGMDAHFLHNHHHHH